MTTLRSLEPWPWRRTLAITAAMALAFTVIAFALNGGSPGDGHNGLRWLQVYAVNFVIAACVGLAIRLLFVLLLRLFGAARIARWSPARRAVFFSGVPMLGVAVGAPIGVLLSGQGERVWFDLRDTHALVASLLLSVLICTIFFLIFNARSRQAEAEQRAAEAQLRLLQGQIEPHFLFNTLANVAALIEADAPKARAMLESFTDYLRASLGSLRGGQSTLVREIGLAQAYLAVLKSRMEERLAFSIEHDPALADAPMPALLLQPLVENAVHHGLEPKLEGGRVQVKARAEGRTLVLEVSDDGQGLAAAAARRRKGHGLALANLRERLQTLYGAQASLSLDALNPGTRATLRLPIDTPP
ncbi:sensor histidine kinase [Aquabacterium sp.]|uniref:sensor histidine kinase n=1 Tax=Aquabacterium sp. TaxID=1872578 RepID=UPI0037842DC2